MMKTVPTNCPQCNSIQKFALRRRETDFEWFDVYIRCNMCHWEKILYPSTKALEDIRTRIRKWGEKAQREIDTTGAMSGTTSIKLRKLRKDRIKLTIDLTERVKAANGGVSPYT